MAAEDPTLKPILVHENFIKTQKFQYFLVLDFEATCDSSAQPVPQVVSLKLAVLILYCNTNHNNYYRAPSLFLTKNPQLKIDMNF